MLIFFQLFELTSWLHLGLLHEGKPGLSFIRSMNSGIIQLRMYDLSSSSSALSALQTRIHNPMLRLLV